tara:strand:- start:2 stop:196 length:195 start_codon:yes stop_codon:yes gene_type:complete
MNRQNLLIVLLMLLSNFNLKAQEDSVISQMIKEAETNSQLEILGQELLDGIGPRLVGTPQMKVR